MTPTWVNRAGRCLVAIEINPGAWCDFPRSYRYWAIDSMECDLIGQALLEQMKAENEKLTAAGAGGADNEKLEELLAAKQAELQVRQLWGALGEKTCARASTSGVPKQTRWRFARPPLHLAARR